MSEAKLVLVAGATGYLGRHVVRRFHDAGYRVRALTRSRDSAADIAHLCDAIVVGDVTDAASLNGIADGVDVVVSTVGITRRQGRRTYEEVDHRGNGALLAEALRAGVGRFVYVSLFGADALGHLRIVRAKEAFVRELTASPISSIVVRPNGFFSDMREFLEMAGRGRVLLFGSGDFRMNPIDGGDVADREAGVRGGRAGAGHVLSSCMVRPYCRRSPPMAHAGLVPWTDRVHPDRVDTRSRRAAGGGEEVA